MKLSTYLKTAAVVGQMTLAVYTPATSAQTGNAPATYPYGQSRPISGRYIVVFKDSVANPAAEAASLMQGRGGQVHHAYATAIKGFAASIPAAAVQGIRNNPNVEYIEQDQTVSLSQVASPQNQVTWGLDRIDQADLPLDTQYHFSQTGAGVNAFIIDTGIRADHGEFTGRIRSGFGAVADGNGTNDCQGHGTHVAGTVGGTTWGVAKGIALIPVRVLDCNGQGASSDVIAGIDWVATSTLRPAVANMSLGGSVSTSLDAAVAGAVARGVTMVVAAGNSNIDACTVSPAREPSAITVGAINSTDYRANYSNTGSCLDLFAPGHMIMSAGIISSSASNLLSGTSMAAPHVSGVAALMLQTSPGASPAAVAAQIVAQASTNRVVYPGIGSPNLLLTSLGSTTVPPEPAKQTVAFKSMTGSGARAGGNWKASALVTVRDINSGGTVANASVTGSFSPGGTSTCVTSSNGSCTLNSGVIKVNTGPSTVLSGTGISGTLMIYDASQNAVTQIVISRP